MHCLRSIISEVSILSGYSVHSNEFEGLASLSEEEQTPGSQLDCALPCRGLSYSWGVPLNGDKSDSTLGNSFTVIPCQAAAIRRCPVGIENGVGCMDPKDRTCRRRTHRIVHRIDNAFHANILIELKTTYSIGGMVL